MRIRVHRPPVFALASVNQAQPSRAEILIRRKGVRCPDEAGRSPGLAAGRRRPCQRPRTLAAATLAAAALTTTTRAATGASTSALATTAVTAAALAAAIANPTVASAARD